MLFSFVFPTCVGWRLSAQQICAEHQTNRLSLQIYFLRTPLASLVIRNCFGKELWLAEVAMVMAAWFVLVIPLKKIRDTRDNLARCSPGARYQMVSIRVSVKE